MSSFVFVLSFLLLCLHSLLSNAAKTTTAAAPAAAAPVAPQPFVSSSANAADDGIVEEHGWVQPPSKEQIEASVAKVVSRAQTAAQKIGNWIGGLVNRNTNTAGTSFAEVEAEAEMEVEAETEMEAEAEVEAETEVDAEADADADAELDADAEAEMEADADSESEVDAEAQLDAEAEAEAEVESEAEVDAESEAEAEAEIDAMDFHSDVNTLMEVFETAEVHGITAPWYPSAVKVVTGMKSGAAFPAGGKFRVVLHTTEGSSAAGAANAYKAAGGTNPHFTVTFEKQAFVVNQHIPITHAGRALKRPAGTCNTNNAHAIQIEIVGFAEKVKTLPDAYLDGIGTLVRWIQGQTGVQKTAPKFLPYPASYANKQGQRFTCATWAAFNGGTDTSHTTRMAHHPRRDCFDFIHVSHLSSSSPFLSVCQFAVTSTSRTTLTVIRVKSTSRASSQRCLK